MLSAQVLCLSQGISTRPAILPPSVGGWQPLTRETQLSGRSRTLGQLVYSLVRPKDTYLLRHRYPPPPRRKQAPARRRSQGLSLNRADVSRLFTSPSLVCYAVYKLSYPPESIWLNPWVQLLSKLKRGEINEQTRPSAIHCAKQRATLTSIAFSYTSSSVTS